MELYKNKEMCTGCTACKNICPKQAISMVTDSEGFLYPIIDESKCVDCGLCNVVCPTIGLKEKNKTIVSYIAQNTNEGDLKKSSSGGVVVLLARKILDKGGSVFGAAFDESLELKHIEVNSVEELDLVLGSKYVQSNPADSFSTVHKLLKEQKVVMYVGTPCEIEGLSSYLNLKKADTSNLLLVDIMCHGCPSPLVFKKYLGYRKRIDGGDEFVKINFRDKIKGWRNISNTYTYKNGKEYTANVDIFFRGFLRNAYLRPSCYACHFKEIDRVSDITLGDSWSMGSINAGLDNDKGHSFVICHTPKGEEAITSSKDELFLFKVNSKIENGGLYESAYLNPEREKIFKNLEKLDFDELYNRYFSDKIWLKIRRTLARKRGKTKR